MEALLATVMQESFLSNDYNIRRFLKKKLSRLFSLFKHKFPVSMLKQNNYIYTSNDLKTKSKIVLESKFYTIFNKYV